jgi:putative phosphoribosyl transferase
MFSDRHDAGRQLADRLRHLAGPRTIVLGLPRGGVPVAFEVASTLHAPLDVILVRKLGVPYQPELGMGAIGEDDVRVVNDEVVHAAGLGPADIEAVEKRERAELERRSSRFRASRPRLDLTGKTAVVVDDGIATGSTAVAACQVARASGASKVVLAVPVGPPDCEQRFRDVVDEFVCLRTPGGFYAIGQFYDDFSATHDDEVVGLLTRASATVPEPSVSERAVLVGDESLALPGQLSVPHKAPGIVLFAHGSGSSRLSPRNQQVASVLEDAGLGTLLFDLLKTSEDQDRSAVFDIELLATRLTAATAWLRHQDEAEGKRLGYFGASTGAAAALWAAAEPLADIAAVVSRGGRPDLARSRLEAVRSPTLLIVGSLDLQVLELNRRAQERLVCENRLSVVHGATHLFEEQGTLTEAANLARDWFMQRL